MKSWAMIVGINEYPTATGQRTLEGAVADAADFADWALDPEYANVAPENLYLWTYPAPVDVTPRVAEYLNPPAVAGGAPTAPPLWFDPATGGESPANFQVAPDYTTITQTAYGLREDAATATYEGNTETKRCYVYFAGHGVQTTSAQRSADLQPCFITGDFRPTIVNTIGLIPCLDLRMLLLAQGFDEVFMFLDCCRLGGSAFDGQAPFLKSSQVGTNIWGMGMATHHGGIAYETTVLPIRGAFTKTLMEALRSYRNAQSELTIEDLKTYVWGNIMRHAPKVQKPDISSANNDGTILIIAKRVAAPALEPDIVNPDLVPPVVIAQPLPTILVSVMFGDLDKSALIQVVDGKGQPFADSFSPSDPGLADRKELELEAGKVFSLDISMPGEGPHRSETIDLSVAGGPVVIQL
jgi:hypothetical protein